jgi:hypothetical protein
MDVLLSELLAAAQAHPDAAQKKAAETRWKAVASPELQAAAKATLKAGLGKQQEPKVLERIEAFAAAVQQVDRDFDVVLAALARAADAGIRQHGADEVLEPEPIVVAHGHRADVVGTGGLLVPHDRAAR